MNRREADRMAARLVAGLIRVWEDQWFGGARDEVPLTDADKDRLTDAVGRIEHKLNIRGGEEINDVTWFDPKR